MSKKNEINKAEQSQRPQLLLKQQAVFSGPIPHPQILEQYGKIDPSLPDRIMKMAEKDLQVKHNMNYLGWFSTFFLSIILIGGGIYLIADDKSIVGLITLASSAIFPILQLSFGRKSKKD